MNSQRPSASALTPTQRPDKFIARFSWFLSRPSTEVINSNWKSRKLLACKYFTLLVKYNSFYCRYHGEAILVLRSELFDPFIKSGVQIYRTNFNWEITLPVQISALLAHLDWALTKAIKYDSTLTSSWWSYHLTQFLVQMLKNLIKREIFYVVSRIVLKCWKENWRLKWARRDESSTLLLWQMAPSDIRPIC